MIKYSVALCIAVFGLVSTRAAGTEDPPKVLENYSDANKYIIVIGRVEQAKMLRATPELHWESADYAVKIKIERVVRGNGFSRKHFSANINFVDIDYAKTRKIVFVLDKGPRSNVVTWNYLSDVLCLDEKRLISEGWIEISGNALNDNCVEF